MNDDQISAEEPLRPLRLLLLLLGSCAVRGEEKKTPKGWMNLSERLLSDGRQHRRSVTITKKEERIIIKKSFPYNLAYPSLWFDFTGADKRSAWRMSLTESNLAEAALQRSRRLRRAAATLTCQIRQDNCQLKASSGRLEVPVWVCWRAGLFPGGNQRKQEQAWS